MDANEFLVNFESRFRGVVGSIDLYRMRPANSDLLVSLMDGNDFLRVVKSACSVNIPVEIGWLFEPKKPQHFEMGSCFLRFKLSNECIDERLNVFLDDICLSLYERNE